MPCLDLDLPTTPSPEVAAKAAEALTRLTAELLGKKPELTAVAITATPRDHWYVDGRALKSGQASFHLGIKVTEGTNTKNEKARDVEAVFEATTTLLGHLASASHVVVHEVHADAWGYAGQTQEFRHIKGKPLRALCDATDFEAPVRLQRGDALTGAFQRYGTSSSCQCGSNPCRSTTKP